MEDYHLETDYAVGRLRVSGGVVVWATPIFRRFFGRLFTNVQAWAEANNYKLEKLPPYPSGEDQPLGSRTPEQS